MSITGPTTDAFEIRTWAVKHGVAPFELLPRHVDGEPAFLRLVSIAKAEADPNLKRVSWEFFFEKLTQLRLAVVYDEDHTGYSEILQIEANSPRPFLRMSR